MKNTNKKNTNSFINESNIKHDYKYNYNLTEYKNNYTKLIITCPIHGNFIQKPTTHLSGSGCQECGKILKEEKAKQQILTTIEFINKANKIHNNKFDYQETKYTGIHDKVSFKCPIHGKQIEKASDHLLYQGCKKCNKNKLRTTEEIKLDFVLIHGSEYDYSNVEFVNTTTKIDIICRKHGIFKQTPNAHLSGRGCKKCKASLGEKRISKYFNDNKIIYHQEYKFDDCLSIKNHKLKFDFYLPNLNTCIEFDGQQHFECNHFFGEESFNITQRNDIIKNKYCLDNNIHLLRIKYTDHKIVEIIIEEFLKTTQIV